MSDAFLYLGGLALAAYFFRLWLEDYRHNAQQIDRDLAAGKTISAESIQTGLPGSCARPHLRCPPVGHQRPVALSDSGIHSGASR